jgi:hypothetical protein
MFRTARNKSGGDERFTRSHPYSLSSVVALLVINIRNNLAYSEHVMLQVLGRYLTDVLSQKFVASTTLRLIKSSYVFY